MKKNKIRFNNLFSIIASTTVIILQLIVGPSFAQTNYFSGMESYAGDQNGAHIKATVTYSLGHSIYAGIHVGFKVDKFVITQVELADGTTFTSNNSNLLPYDVINGLNTFKFSAAFSNKVGFRSVTKKIATNGKREIYFDEFTKAYNAMPLGSEEKRSVKDDWLRNNGTTKVEIVEIASSSVNALLRELNRSNVTNNKSGNNTSNSSSNGNSSSNTYRTANGVEDVRTQQQAAQKQNNTSDSKLSAAELQRQQINQSNQRNSGKTSSSNQKSSSSNQSSRSQDNTRTQATVRHKQQQEVNRVIAENQRRIERQDREVQQLLNNWENKMQTDYQLYSREYDSYENFKSRTSNLSSLNASTYRELISEFNSKIAQLDREYSNREREVNQQIRNRMNAAKTGEHDWVNDVAATLHQQQAQKKLKEEKQQAENKLRREKEEKKKVFVDRFKTDVARDRNKALDRAKYAVSKDVEIYYIKLYSYFDCLYKDPYGTLNNNSYCNEPQGQPAISNKNYSGEDLYQAYKRKKNSSFKEIKDEAEQFLEMAIRRNPNNPQWLYEKSLTSNNTSEKLGLLNKAVKLEPNNTQYKSEQLEVKKKRYGEIGEVGDKVNGKKHGKWVEYWSDGEVKQIVNYKNGKLIGQHLMFYDSDWKETNDRYKYQYYSVMEYDSNGNISLKRSNFYKSGRVQMIGQYQDEEHKIKTGEFKKYYESGNLKTLEKYKNGKLDGKIVNYSESGIIKSKITYEGGELLNYLELRDDQGNPIKSGPFQNGLAKLKLTNHGKIGYINQEGFVVVPIHYDWADSFTNEIAIVMKNNKYGGVNKNGEEVIPLIYDKLEWLENGLISARKDKRTGTVDKNGKESLTLRFDLPYTYSKEITFDYQGFALVKKEGKFGFIDKEGNTIIDFKYDGAIPFFDKEITRVEVDKKSEFGTDTKYGYINRDGINITPIIYEYAYPFKNGFGWVKKNGLMTFVNENGKEIIEPIYSELLRSDQAAIHREDSKSSPYYEFNEGLARVKKNNKFGFIDEKGKVVIDILYDEVSHFENGKAIIVHSIFGLQKINKLGEIVSQEKIKQNPKELIIKSHAEIVERAFKEMKASQLKKILHQKISFKQNRRKRSYNAEGLTNKMQLFFDNYPYQSYMTGILNTKKGKTIKFDWITIDGLYFINVKLEKIDDELKVIKINIKEY